MKAPGSFRPWRLGLSLGFLLGAVAALLASLTLPAPASRRQEGGAERTPAGAGEPPAPRPSISPL